jgi:ABC-type sulfate/molybdate transport systems ATPase subunit
VRYNLKKVIAILLSTFYLTLFLTVCSCCSNKLFFYERKKKFEAREKFMSLLVDIKKKLKGFSLEIAFKTDGEYLGILGASGSGKSMTLKCIAGVETPDEGRIMLNGKVLFDSEKKINLKPQDRNIGHLLKIMHCFLT